MEIFILTEENKYDGNVHSGVIEIFNSYEEAEKTRKELVKKKVEEYLETELSINIEQHHINDCIEIYDNDMSQDDYYKYFISKKTINN